MVDARATEPTLEAVVGACPRVGVSLDLYRSDVQGCRKATELALSLGGVKRGSRREGVKEFPLQACASLYITGSQRS